MGSLDLRRANGRAVANELERRGGSRLGVVFSGFGYSYRDPLLRWTKRAFLEKGLDYWGVDLGYRDDPEFMALEPAAQDEAFEADCAVLVRALRELAEGYGGLVLAGKSMGTSVVRRCLKAGLGEGRHALALFTPGTEWRDFALELAASKVPAFLAASLEDPHYVKADLAPIRSRSGLRLFELPRGDHLLETGSLVEDLETQARLFAALLDFLDETGRSVEALRRLR